MTHLKEGDIAPDFTLPIRVNKLMSLNELKNIIVILYFYPKDDTPGCSIEAQKFNALKAKFEELGAKIIGISKDDLTSHEKFQKKYNLEIDLAFDEGAKVCQQYGVWIKKSMMGREYMGIQRSTFLIGPEGIIAKIWENIDVTEHADEVLAAVKNLKTQ